LAAAGRPVAAVVFGLVAACSAYLVELLSLPYSGVGFYLVACIALAALAVHAVLGRAGPWGTALRLAAMAAVLTVCALCRSGTLFLLPGVALAIGIGAYRRVPGSSPRRLAAAVGLVLAFAGALAAPYLALSASRRLGHHEVWLGIWEGLGDFDRTGVHAWDDAAAKAFLRAHGRPAPVERPIWSLDNEAFFREQMLDDVRSAPGWYAAILGKRLVATTSQARLWTGWPRASGRTEEVIRSYYGLASSADLFSLGPWSVWIPIPLLIAATLLALRRPSAALVLLCVAVGTCALPVLVTTASGPETQAFSVVYWLGLGFACEELAAVGRRYIRR
jgi:hypothetical protein